MWYEKNAVLFLLVERLHHNLVVLTFKHDQITEGVDATILRPEG